MTPNSFNFGSINSVDEWGLYVNAYDLLVPPKRARKATVPGRSGSYDYGARYYDERPLRLECTVLRKLSKAELREMAYHLSQKREIRFWDEPDKYYIGELYDPDEVNTYPNEAMRDFELTFTCEPFAYRPLSTQAISSGANPVTYKGTAEAPAIIELFNPNNYAVGNIVLTAVKRRS